MIFVPRLAIVSGLIATLVPAVFAAKVRQTTPVEGIYSGVVVTDAATGQVLFEDNADATNPPASMTKLMTFAVLHDKLADGSLTPQTSVQIDASDAKMGGTQVYLDPREVFTVEELIYAMMIQSANDAAHALARAAAGSPAAFVDLMNAKARALGMTRTTFRTPHGLPPPSRRVEDGDLSTPHDFALLCRHLVLNTDVLKYTAVRDRTFGAGRAQGPIQMRNHNNLLGKIAGVDGLKTGYTQSAGYCLSATAERNGRRVIAVIMGSFGPGRSIDKGRARDLKAIELIDRGFAAPLDKLGALSPSNGLPAGPMVGGALRPDSTGEAVLSGHKAPPTKETASGELPTVKTDKEASAAPALPEPSERAEQQTSTPTEPMFKFRVIPPEKTP